MALGHLLLWFCSGYACYTFYHQEFWLLFVLALSLHGTIGSFFNIAHHELCHKTVFKTKWLNSFFLRLFAENEAKRRKSARSAENRMYSKK